MSWKYSQTSGILEEPDGVTVAGVGYSGKGAGLNNPDYQNIPDVGPLPQGSYEMGKAYNSAKHGPLTIPLTPLEGTETFGRDEFKCHGDEKEHPGMHQASLGCLIMGRAIRERLNASPDHTLQVTA